MLIQRATLVILLGIKGMERKRGHFALIAIFLGTPLRNVKIYMTIHQDTSQKGRTMPLSSNLSSGAGNTASNLCPISKTQCEQLLAFLSIGSRFSESHHAATVRASSVACVEGDPGGAFDVISS